MRGAGSALFGTGPARPSIKHLADGPGPGASFRMTKLGTSAISGARNAPAISIRSREIWERDAKRLLRAPTPGPGAYSCTEDPKFEHPPAITIATRIEDKTIERRAKSTPSPDSYVLPGGLGPQPLSTKPTRTAMSFGTSARETISKSGIAVGPGEYDCVAGIGKQILSDRPTSSSYTLGSRRELRAKPASVRTGPAQFKAPEGLGRQVLSTRPTAPRARIAGRTKFRSLYGD